MNDTTFFDIIFQSADFRFGGRDEIEDPLDEALQQAGLGEVTGGGSGMGTSNIDIEVSDPVRALPLIREVLRSLGVAHSTLIRQAGPPPNSLFVYEPSP